MNMKKVISFVKKMMKDYFPDWLSSITILLMPLQN